MENKLSTPTLDPDLMAATLRVADARLSGGGTPEIKTFSTEERNWTLEAVSVGDYVTNVAGDQAKDAAIALFDLFKDELAEEIIPMISDRRRSWTLMKKLRTIGKAEKLPSGQFTRLVVNSLKADDLVLEQFEDGFRNPGFMSDRIMSDLRRAGILEDGKELLKNGLKAAATNALKSGANAYLDGDRMEAFHQLGLASLEYLLVHNEADRMFLESRAVTRQIDELVSQAGKHIFDIAESRRQLELKLGDKVVELEEEGTPVILVTTWAGPRQDLLFAIGQPGGVPASAYRPFDSISVRGNSRLALSTLNRSILIDAAKKGEIVQLYFDILGNDLEWRHDTDPATIASLKFELPFYENLKLANVEGKADTTHRIRIRVIEKEDDNWPAELALVEVRHPAIIPMNGPEQTLVLVTSGLGQLPYTATIEPANCPSDVRCETTQQIFEELSPNGEYAWNKALWCTGSGPGWPFLFQVYITDAMGFRTETRPINAFCRR